ncbi:mitochondrial intermembrane space import and assembly protein 40 homolog isoform X2 [Amaranthus tricolor]|uniref:mitochondrial intermembrane space import and assembly protein 40 homolog isoform X2 n=1 Tax=Amaranthus tricolor TaxID=29722 RepID=UPI00258BA552|nr:mitochondrial intermembrane space import and assembly protein 40 homolog isoform X2 [Amaranthus tricolor]
MPLLLLPWILYLQRLLLMVMMRMRSLSFIIISMEAKAKKALECPCIADLRKGACGSQFSEAFFCFLKSTAEEKGSDCVHPFVALQSCIKANANAFTKDIVEDDQVKKEEGSSADYRILPPKWSLESPNFKSRS